MAKEIEHIKDLVAVEKLTDRQARDLREYTTLLTSMKKAHNEAGRERTERSRAKVAALSIADLEAAARDK